MSTFNQEIARMQETIMREQAAREEKYAKKVEKARENNTYVERKQFDPKKWTRNKFEKWDTIKGYDDMYWISTSGRIWSAYRGMIMKPIKHPHTGYWKIRLKNPETGKFDTKYLHRLVAETFIPNPEDKPEVNHNDGNKENCSVWNLCWMTREENMRHAQMNGLGNVKLKPLEVQSIYYLAHASDINQEEIARMYGVSRTVISSIKNRDTWDFMTHEEVQAEMGICL